MRCVTLAIMLAAAVAGAKGRPAERLVLERDTLVKSALGPILVRRGEAFFYEHGGGQDAITVNDHLARGVLARPHTLLGFHFAAGSDVQLWEPAGVEAAIVVRLGHERTTVYFWPSGKPLCAYSGKQEIFITQAPTLRRDADKNYASVFFDPAGEPRLVAVDEAYVQGDRQFEIVRAGRKLRYKAIGKHHPLWRKFYRGCDATRPETVRWLSGVSARE